MPWVTCWGFGRDGCGSVFHEDDTVTTENFTYCKDCYAGYCMRGLRVGDKVRLTAEAKRLMTGKRHPLLDSAEHIDEFGGCVGVVEGLLDGRGPELGVRWQPSGLYYGYPAEHLEKA